MIQKTKQRLPLQKKSLQIFNLLEQAYPNPTTDLNYDNSFQLLITVILSAQTTDKQVNKITKDLFKVFPTAQALAQGKQSEVENLIKGIGLYRNKAKNIINSAQMIINRFNNEIPSSMDLLTQLPGVGRKSASVVLAVVFKKPAFPVDTHVFRLCQRLGLSAANNPFGVERDIKELIAAEYWINFHHLLINHGRKICLSRKPKCEQCILVELCFYCKN